MNDEYFMKMALKEAETAFQAEEVPVGAIVIFQDRIIARAHNLCELLNDVTAHAEMQAITSAMNLLGAKYLSGCTIYVTVEPCIMCAGALGWSQISRIVYGASDEKRGYSLFSPSPLHPKTEVARGIMEKECGELMSSFFKRKR